MSEAWTSISGGPERVVTGQHDPNFKRRPVGFAPPEQAETEPRLWEGDDA